MKRPDVFHKLFLLLILAACTIGKSDPSISPGMPVEANPASVRLTPSPLLSTPERTEDTQTIVTEESTGLSLNEISTLSSLKKVNDFPLYQMTYAGDYQVKPRPQRGQLEGDKTELPRPAWGCSLFTALADENGRLFGRNFDWEYSPALLLTTAPSDGYHSISMVDIAYLFDYAQVQNLDELPLMERQGLLQAPGMPFDGMNEKGLVIAMAAVPPGNVAPDPKKETLDSLEIIRIVLDHAASVSEAVEILQEYNINFTGGPPLHYLIADRTGQAVLVEFFAGQVVEVAQEGNWHAATNFLRTGSSGSDEGQCWRFARIRATLEPAGGYLTPASALNLLDQVSQANTQWSVVYGMNTGKVQIVMGRRYNQPDEFSAFTNDPAAP